MKADPFHTSAGRRLGLVASLAALLALLSVWGCASKSGVTNPDSQPDDDIGPDDTVVLLQENVLSWQTDQEVRAAVWYTVGDGPLDHVAYPASFERRDLSFRTDHRVPLLDLREGEMLRYRRIQDTPDGRSRFSAEDTLVASVGAVERQLTSTMIHIGWGDAHLLTMPNSGQRILIDAGDRDAAGILGDYFQSEGITHLDAALSTHVHIDHNGGFVGDDDNPGLLETLDVDVYIDSPSKTHFRPVYEETRTLLDQEGITRLEVQRGDDDGSFPEFASWDPQVDVVCLNSSLADDVPIGGHEGTNINNESITLRISYGDVDLVIGGDTELESEESILADFTQGQLDSELYKAHHHGRYDGGGIDFLRAINPRVSFVPVSWKEYGGGWSDYWSSSAPQITRIESLGAHRFGIDDLPLMDRERSVFNYNVTFATDGASYEVRIAEARQRAKAPRTVGAHSCDEEPASVLQTHFQGEQP